MCRLREDGKQRFLWTQRRPSGLLRSIKEEEIPSRCCHRVGKWHLKEKLNAQYSMKQVNQPD